MSEEVKIEGRGKIMTLLRVSRNAKWGAGTKKWRGKTAPVEEERGRATMRETNGDGGEEEKRHVR